MLRVCATAIAVVTVAAASMPAASAKELKPKFGNIDGVYYSDVSGNREACRQAINNKIALCRQNTNFESNTKNRKYGGCLRIFRQQAQSCVVHFRHQMSKCNLSGAARITDFTGFSCEVTKTVVEDGGGPGISPMDRRMKARTLVNLRAGPGTNHPVVGALSSGQEVQVTGRAGAWLRIAMPGRTAFVHGQFMVGTAGKVQRGQSAGQKAPGSGRANPALAAARNRCKDVLYHFWVKIVPWQINCVPRNRGRAECKNLKKRRAAVIDKWVDACCGTFRASSSREEQMVSYLKENCGDGMYLRCRRDGGSRSSCARHRRSN